MPHVFWLQVELAHGGRGPSSSDRRGYGGSGGGGGGGGASGGRFGISRHSEFRGMFIVLLAKSCYYGEG